MKILDTNGDSRTIVIFDTDCVLCSAWVRFLLRHEDGNSLHFASSRKPLGIGLAQKHGVTLDALDLTYLVILNGKALTKSDASLGLLATLKAPWRYLGILRILPRGFRNWIYDIVARHRLSWFGEKKDCFLPTPAQRSRFLDHLPGHGEPTKGSE